MAVKYVSEFKYLRFIVEAKGGTAREVQEREQQKQAKAFGSMQELLVFRDSTCWRYKHLCKMVWTFELLRFCGLNILCHIRSCHAMLPMPCSCI